MGSGDVYGSLFAGFSVWAWMWIGVGALAVIGFTYLILRSRARSAWLRTPEETARLERSLRRSDDGGDQLAS